MEPLAARERWSAPDSRSRNPDIWELDPSRSLFQRGELPPGQREALGFLDPMGFNLGRKCIIKYNGKRGYIGVIRGLNLTGLNRGYNEVMISRITTGSQRV